MAGGGETALIHRDHVVYVTLHNDDEPRDDPGYEFAVTHSVSVLLTDGRRSERTGARLFTREVATG